MVARSLRQNMADHENLIVALLFTDVDIAFTFLESARITNWPESKDRCIANAVKAYQYVSSKAEHCTMPLTVRKELDRVLVDLKQKITEFGPRN